MKLSKEQLLPNTNSVYLENKKYGLFPQLQEICLQHPIIVVRRIAGALRVDPGWFSTKPLNELQPDHPVQIKAQLKQGSDKNWDPNTQQQEHGFKVYLAYEHKFRQQLQELMKLPHWTQVVSAGNMLSYIGYLPSACL